ncbi:protein of unknown function [Burkholderia multivorans]
MSARHSAADASAGPPARIARQVAADARGPLSCYLTVKALPCRSNSRMKLPSIRGAN